MGRRRRGSLCPRSLEASLTYRSQLELQLRTESLEHISEASLKLRVLSSKTVFHRIECPTRKRSNVK